MHRYIINRILLMIPTLLGVAIISFVLLRMVPGDIVLLKLAGDGGRVDEARAPAGAREARARQADRAAVLDWIAGAVRLDFGLSMWTGRPIIDEIALRLELSLQLTIMASIIATLLALPLGRAGRAEAGYLGRLRHPAVQHRAGWRCRASGSASSRSWCC